MRDLGQEPDGARRVDESPEQGIDETRVGTEASVAALSTVNSGPISHAICMPSSCWFHFDRLLTRSCVLRR